MGSKLTNNIECEIFQVLLEEARASYPEDIVVALRSDSVEDISRNVAALSEWANNWRPDMSVWVAYLSARDSLARARLCELFVAGLLTMAELWAKIKYCLCKFQACYFLQADGVV